MRISTRLISNSWIKIISDKLFKLLIDLPIRWESFSANFYQKSIFHFDNLFLDILQQKFIQKIINLKYIFIQLNLFIKILVNYHWNKFTLTTDEWIIITFIITHKYIFKCWKYVICIYLIFHLKIFSYINE